MNRTHLVIMLVVLALASGSCNVRILATGSHESIGVVESSISVPGLKSLKVRVGAGSITVIEGASGEVKISADVLYDGGEKKAGRRADLTKDVKVDVNGGALTVSDAHMSASDQNAWQSKLTLTVPAGLELDLDVAAGACHTSASTPKLKARVAAGDLVISGAALGEIDAKTSTGELKISSKGTLGNVMAEVGAGSLVIEVPSAFTGDVDLATSVGNVTLKGTPELKVAREVTSASCRGKIGSGATTVRGRTGTGDVRFSRS